MSGTATFALRTDGRPDAVGRVGAAIALVLCAMIFNLVLAVINTSIAPIAEAHVISAEVAIVAAAMLLIGGGSTAFFGVAGIVGVWLASTMAVRGQLDPKVCRDALIPVVFYFLGRRYGTLRTCDRLVGLAVVMVAVGALLEWAFLDVYLRYVDILRYYIAKGSAVAQSAAQMPELYVSGMRNDGRTILPFLGDHRVSSIFLEPVSVGNFGVIAFAWVLLRAPDGTARFIRRSLLVFLILVLGDARFGLYLCGVVALVYLVAPVLRPGLVYSLPFVIVPLLLVNATGFEEATWLNDLPGRLLLSGQLLSTIDAGQALGVRATTSAAMVVLSDSGYASIIAEFGAIGAAGLGALFVFASPAESQPSWRFKLFVCFYLIVLLTISTSFLSIKTAALLWFLAGGTSGGSACAPKSLPGGSTDDRTIAASDNSASGRGLSGSPPAPAGACEHYVC
jgi:putative polymerase